MSLSLLFFSSFCARRVYFRTWCFTRFFAIVFNGGFEGTSGVGLLDLCAKALLMLPDCIALFYISLFTIVFYIKDNLRFICGGEGKNKILRKKQLVSYELVTCLELARQMRSLWVAYTQLNISSVRIQWVQLCQHF